MFSHHRHTRSTEVPEEPANASSPGSPKVACNITRYGNSSGGGTSGNSSSAGGGYATRHTMSQVAAAAAGDGSGGKSVANNGGSGGRSMASSRRASVTERTSHAHAAGHTRTASGDVSSLTAELSGGVTSPSAHNSRSFYSKVLSYRRSSATSGTAAAAAASQQQEVSQNSPRSQHHSIAGSPRHTLNPQSSSKYAAKAPAPAAPPAADVDRSQVNSPTLQPPAQPLLAVHAAGSSSAAGSPVAGSPAVTGKAWAMPFDHHQLQQKQQVLEAVPESAQDKDSGDSHSSSTGGSPNSASQPSIAAQPRAAAAAAAAYSSAATSDDETETGDEAPMCVAPAAVPACVSPVPVPIITALSAPRSALLEAAAAAKAGSETPAAPAAGGMADAAATAAAEAAAQVAAVLAGQQLRATSSTGGAAAPADAANSALLLTLEALTGIPAAAQSSSAVERTASLGKERSSASSGVGGGSGKSLDSEAAARAVAAIFSAGNSFVCREEGSNSAGACEGMTCQGSSNGTVSSSNISSAEEAAAASCKAAAQGGSAAEAAGQQECGRGASKAAAAEGAADMPVSPESATLAEALAFLAAKAAAGTAQETAATAAPQAAAETPKAAESPKPDTPSSAAARAAALDVKLRKQVTKKNSKAQKKEEKRQQQVRKNLQKEVGDEAGSALASPAAAVDEASEEAEQMGQATAAVGAAAECSAEAAAVSKAAASQEQGVEGIEQQQHDAAAAASLAADSAAADAEAAAEAATDAFSSSAAAAAIASDGVAGGGAGDYRYSELIFRLQQFLPALKAAGTVTSDFESTWELLKVCVGTCSDTSGDTSGDTAGDTASQNQTGQLQQADEATGQLSQRDADNLFAMMCELGALVSSAKIASLQAGRLEVLDSEVVQLQKLLVRVGQHIKAGAQQQQLRDLVSSFPSFAKRQIMEDGSSSDPSSPLSSGTHKPAAVFMSPTGKYPTSRHSHQGMLSSINAAAGSLSAWGASSNPASPGATLMGASGIFGLYGGDEGAAGAGAGAGSGVDSGRSSQRTSGAGAIVGGTSSRGGLMSVAGAMGASEAAGGALSAPCKHAGRSSSNGRSSGLPGSDGGLQRLFGGSSGSPPRSSSPCQARPLTPEEAAQLISLYKVRNVNEPQRIFYKTLKLANKSSNSSNSRYGDRSRDASPSSPSPRRCTSPSAGGSSRHRVSVGSAEDTFTGHHRMHITPKALASAGEGSAGPHCSGSDPACDDMYHAVDGFSGAASRSLPNIAEISSLQYVRSSWSSQMPKGFRAMKSIPEAHKKASPSGPASLRESVSPVRASGPGPRRAGGSPTRAGSQERSSAISPNGRAAASWVGYPGHPHVHRQADMSPDRLSGLRQAHARPSSAPIRSSGAAEQHSMHSSSSVRSPPKAAAAGWTYPTRNSRNMQPAACSNGGGFGGLGGRAAEPGALCLPAADPYPRARSTSPSVGMHYLERSPIFKVKGPAAAAAMRSSCPSGIASSSLGTCKGLGTGVGAGTGAASKFPGGVGASAVLGDDPKFRAASKVFLEQHTAEDPKLSSGSNGDGQGGAKLAARLQPMRDADSQQIDATMTLLVSTLKGHGVSLELNRLGPFLYSAAGRKLRIRMLNGNLLVRTGGGYQDMIDALGKLPLSLELSGPTSSTVSSSSSSSSNTAGGSDEVPDLAGTMCSTGVISATEEEEGTAGEHSGTGSSAGEEKEKETGEECELIDGAGENGSAVQQVGQQGRQKKLGSSGGGEAETKELVRCAGDGGDVVAVLRVGGVEGFEAQCAAEGAPVGDAAWMAVVAEGLQRLQLVMQDAVTAAK